MATTQIQINPNKTNNNAINLRWVTHQVNSQNTGKYSSNTTGHKNIFPYRGHYIFKTTGYRKAFKTLKEAVEAKDNFISS